MTLNFPNLVLYLFIEFTSFIPVNLRQVGVEHHLYPADGVKSAIGECRGNQACLN